MMKEYLSGVPVKLGSLGLRVLKRRGWHWGVPSAVAAFCPFWRALSETEEKEKDEIEHIKFNYETKPLTLLSGSGSTIASFWRKKEFNNICYTNDYLK